MLKRSLLVLCVGLVPLAASGQVVELDVPGTVLKDVPFPVTVAIDDTLGLAAYQVEVAGQRFALAEDSTASVTAPASGEVVVLRQGSPVTRAPFRAIPGWLSILPPLVAIGIALVYKRVIPALFAGIWLGAMLSIGFSFAGLWQGLLDTVHVHVMTAITDSERASIIIFTLMIGGMVGIIQKNGGTQGIVNAIVRFASTPRKGQRVAAFLGLAIFFDDYANTLVVGNTMRPVTDRLRISREKLAYLVDSTAAPVACIAFVTTWIGYEVGLIGEAIETIDGFDPSAYSVFLSSIPYSFYPILAIFFVFLVAGMGRDFGPMLQAEVRARTRGEVFRPGSKIDEAAMDSTALRPPADKPHRAINALVPIGVLVGSVLVFLYTTGVDKLGPGDHSLQDIIGESDSYSSLLWSSLLGVLAAAAMTISQRLLDLDQIVESWYEGLKGMLFAMIILIMAWSLSSITEILFTAEYLTTVLGTALHPGVVPMLVFFLAAATAFATGSSWGTMGILMPLVIPLAYAVLDAHGAHTPAQDFHIISSTVSAVLAGAVWGDHCSPISDTTILSSMASGCDHLDHVRTQLPYAMTVGLVAVLIGTLPTGFGFPWWASLLIGAAILVFVLMRFGKPVDEIAQTSAA